MARIIHPRPEEGTQEQFGIVFRDGVAEDFNPDTNPILTQALEQHHFVIELDALPNLIEASTVPELKVFADSLGIEYPANIKKADLLDAIAVRLEENAVDAKPPLTLDNFTITRAVQPPALSERSPDTEE
jgi:hypothetical protein